MKLGEIANKLTEVQRQQFTKSSVWNKQTDNIQWPNCLESPSCTRRAWSELQENTAITLKEIIRSFGGVPFKEEQLLEVVPKGSMGVSYRVGLLKLLEAGIIFAVRRGWGEKFYIVPQDTVLLWYSIIYSYEHLLPIEDLKSVESKPFHDEAISYRPMLSLQLLHCLAEMQRTGMKLTKKGLLTKRTVEKAVKHLHLNEEDLDILLLTNDEEEDSYPLSFRFVMKLFRLHKWVNMRNEALEIHSEYWGRWLSSARMLRESQLLRWLMEHFVIGSTPATHAAATMCQLIPLKWYRMSDIQHALQTVLGSNIGAAVSVCMLERWSRLLESFGWMESLSLTNGETILRWLIDPRLFERDQETDKIDIERRPDEETIRITPDGEVFVYPDSSDHVRWLLEFIGVRHSTNLVSIYKLHSPFLLPEKYGLSPDRIIKKLEKAAGEELPYTVRLAINDSQSLDNQVTEANTAVIMPEINQQLPWNKDEIILDQQPYELLLEQPSYTSLFTGMNEMPVMWIKQLRSYHHSTKREMIERALRWRIAVKLNYSGVIRLFIPERIEDSGKEWAVIGHLCGEQSSAELRLEPAMWQEMMLVIPLELAYE